MDKGPKMKTRGKDAAPPKSVNILGYEMERAENGESPLVPDKEKYDAFFIHDAFTDKVIKDLLVSFKLKKPVLLEGGTSLGKTTIVKWIAAQLGYEVHYINLNGATYVEDLMGDYRPNIEKESASDPDYVFVDGKVTSGLRIEPGKKKIILLDEFNMAKPEILIRLHEILDALEQSGNVMLTEDGGEVLQTSREQTLIVALQNPAGKGYLGREKLDPAQLRRWNYIKLPNELPRESVSHYMKQLFSEGFLKEIPGMKEMLAKYEEFHYGAKQLLENRKIAADQPQAFNFDDRMEPKNVRDYLLAFYQGDLNTTFQDALRYFYANKLENAEDRQKLEELIRMVSYVPEQRTHEKRRDLDDEAKTGKEKTFKGDLESERSYEKKEPKEPRGEKTINLREFFRTGKTGKEKQWHFDSFKKLISSLEKSEVSLEREPQVFTLPERMNDFQIRDHIGEDKLIWPSKEEALAALASTMTDAYRDGRANIVYYKDASGALSYASVRWIASDVEWNCSADQANANEWNAGYRVFYPAT